MSNRHEIESALREKFHQPDELRRNLKTCGIIVPEDPSWNTNDKKLDGLIKHVLTHIIDKDSKSLERVNLLRMLEIPTPQEKDAKLNRRTVDATETIASESREANRIARIALWTSTFALAISIVSVAMSYWR